MINTQEKFKEAKESVGAGWHDLLDAVFAQITHLQTRWLKVAEGKWEKSDKPFFEVGSVLTKEKFGCLRLHVDINFVEHDEKFDREYYVREFEAARNQIWGMITLAECLSAGICEESGEKGRLCNINGWLRTLSPEEEKKLRDKSPRNPSI